MRNFALLAIVFVFGAGSSLAQDGLGDKVQRLFERYDGDGDGKITPAELEDESTFRSLDKDGDGAVTRADFEGLVKPPAESKPPGERPAGERPRPEGMGEVDANGDGKVALEEWLEFQKRLFAKRDANGDGVLDQEELQAMKPPEGKPGEGGEKERAARLKERFRAMDGDGDGAVSREEWKGPPEAFDRIDGDGDGKVTEEEVAGAIKTFRRGEGGKPDLPRPDPAEIYKKLDKDGDGSLSPEEVPEGRAAELDVDGDGKVTLEEFKAGHDFEKRR